MSFAVLFHIVTRSFIWIILLSIEIIEPALGKFVPQDQNFYLFFVTMALVALFAISHLEKGDLVRDMSDLCLYEALVHTYGFFAYILGYRPAEIIWVLMYAVFFLKYGRLLWASKTAHGGNYSSWPVFGIFGWLHQRKARAENIALLTAPTKKQALFAYAYIALCFIAGVVFPKMGILLATWHVCVIALIGTPFFAKRTLLDLKSRNVDYIAKVNEVAAQRAEATAARRIASAQEQMNRELAAKNNELADANAAIHVLLNERERDKEVLEKYNAALRDAAHDMQHPMAVVRIYAERLMQFEVDHAAPSEKRDAISHELTQAMDQMVEFIDATIHSAQVVTGLVQPKVKALDMDSLAKQFQANWLDASNKQGLDRFDIYPKWPTGLYCAGDMMIVKRILRNLLANAIMHSPPGGGILLSMRRRRGGSCLLQVWDKGPGIAEGVGRDGVANFTAFAERVRRDGGSRTGGGYGLGMNNVLQLCAATGLEMQLHARMGFGSVFGFTLPLADAGLVAEAQQYRLDDEMDLDEVRAMLQALGDLPMPRASF